jgi:signal transduction histidine kinase
LANANAFSLFVNYPIQNASIPTLSKPIPDDFIGEKKISLYRLIKSEKEELGIVLVTRTLDDLKNKQAGYLQVGVRSIFAIFAIIILITLWYQASLTRPMKELTKVASTISLDKDYSARAEKTSQDEFGSLTDIFNEMLDSIQESNLLLRSANEEMEQRVERRTKELTLSNKRITEEMKAKEVANEALIKTQQLLSQNEKLANVGQVSSSIAHELRNPMAAIRNSTYFLRLKLTEKKLTEHLEIIDREISRSDQVIQRLLEITKGEDLKKAKTDMQIIAMEAMNYANINKNSKLSIKFKPVPFQLKVDKLLMRQVLSNLFLNAIEAMPNGGSISLVIKQMEDNLAEIIITDEGIGIEEHLLDKIFDPLVTDKKDGIGLGLSLCRDLISRHGGTIRASSEKNKGTKITIQIPIN